MTTCRLIVAATAGLASLLIPHLASAQNICTIGTTSVAFGAYNVFSATATDSTGTVWVECSGPGTVSISLSRGASSTFSPRTMVGAGGTLSYNLYKEAAHTNMWGDGSVGYATPLSVPFQGGNRRTRTVFARIPASQDVGVGSYADSIVATVNF